MISLEVIYYFQPLQLALSCSDLKKIEPRAESGRFVIYTDGEGGLLPMYDIIYEMTDKIGLGAWRDSH